MKIDDVKLWSEGSYNVGHIVVTTRKGWASTLCGSLFLRLPGKDYKPKNICKKCRERVLKSYQKQGEKTA